jgi:hypothetical protein
MNTPVTGKQMDGMVSLDITNSYPIGYLAQLGPYYNDLQERINAQINYTANQADITSQQNAAYLLHNLELEKSGTIPPASASAVSADSIYINGANAVNYANKDAATRINAEYTNAYAIEKSARDASYSAFLTTEASKIRLDRINALSTVMQLGNTPISINPLRIINSSTISNMVSAVEQTAQQKVNDASGNVQAYITNTHILLNNTITKSRSVTQNRLLVSEFNILVRTVIEAVLFPLVEITKNEIVVTQNVPSIILTVAIQLVNNTQAYLYALITNTVTTQINSADSYADILESIARSNDLNMYKQNKLQSILNNSAISINLQSTYTAVTKDIYASAENALAVERLKQAILTDASGNILASQSAIVAISAAAAKISPIAAKTLALNADTSAANSRAVYNAIVNLNTAYTTTTTKEPIILTTATESLTIISSIASIISKVTSNTSVHSARPIMRRALNTVQGILKNAIETEKISLESAEDASSVLSLLNTAYSITPTITDISGINNKLWSINTAVNRAKEVTDKLKERLFLLNRTAHNLVTGSKIAVQTASANAAGINNSNYISRTNRTSRNVYVGPPPAYTGFKANIRANNIIPIRPSLDELVYRNRIQPLRLDSLRSISAVEVKVAQEVQQITDNSAFSYRQ